MKQERMLFNDERHSRKEEAKPVLNIVAAYDSPNTAIRATNLLGVLVRRFGNEFVFQCTLWRFDALGLPQTRDAALIAGGAADLIIICARSDNDLPEAVQDLLRHCLAGRAQGSAALVALLESHGKLGAVRGRTRQFLQNVATGSRLDFFLHEVELPESCPPFAPQDVCSGAKTFTSVAEGLLHQVNRPPDLRA
jgi:ribosomal protein L35AE/L33A